MFRGTKDRARVLANARGLISRAKAGHTSSIRNLRSGTARSHRVARGLIAGHVYAER